MVRRPPRAVEEQARRWAGIASIRAKRSLHSRLNASAECTWVGDNTLEFMETGKASKTALGVAIRRAAHQLMDRPPVLDDPIAVRLVGSGYRGKMGRASHPVGRDFRAFMAVRSRYAEDRLAEAVAQGVTQYVVLAQGWTPLPIAIHFPRCGSSRWIFPPRRSGSGRCCARRRLPCRTI